MKGVHMAKKLIKTQSPMKMITVLLPSVFLDKIEDLVRSGYYQSRSDAVRGAIRSSFIEGTMAEKLKKLENMSP